MRNLETTELRALESQNQELDAAVKFTKQVRRHNMTPVVDDDYPEVRHDYESALAALIQAMKKNGRFVTGNRYGLKQA